MSKGEERVSSFFAEDYSLTVYLKEISRTKALIPEEEVELTRRIKKGDEDALQKLVRSNLRFVVSVARNYQNQGLPLSDLINEGNLGLIRAAKRFDETREFKFISYAVWWVRQAILQALAEHSRIVKLPLNRVGSIHRLGKIISALEQELGRTPSRKEIAKHMKIKEEEVDDTIKIGTNHLSLDAPLRQEEDSSLIDIIKDKSYATPEDNMLRKKLKDDIEEVLCTLGKREAEVVKLYFGIGYDMPHTLEEIGDRFELTRERVRQIKEKALKRLKHISRSDRLRDYLGRF